MKSASKEIVDDLAIKIKKGLLRLYYPATISYIVCIVLVNTLFLWIPFVTIGTFTMTPADFTAGSILIVRDFAQREIKHFILVAMLIGSFFSYLLATREIAIASFTAFATAELIDWSIFTLTKKPLSKRLLWSSLISCPADSFVFCGMLHLHLIDCVIVTLAKFVGVFIVWYLWKVRTAQENLCQPA